MKQTVMLPRSSQRSVTRTPQTPLQSTISKKGKNKRYGLPNTRCGIEESQALVPGNRETAPSAATAEVADSWEEVVVQLEQDEGRSWQSYRLGRGVWNLCGVSKVEMGSTKATAQVLKPQKLQGSL